MAFYSTNPERRELAEAATRFVELFQSQEWDLTHLRHPEAYPCAARAPAQRRLAPSEAARPLHLSFRDAPSLNYLKGARNIVFVPWRWPQAPSIFADHGDIRENLTHLWGLADQLWAPSKFSARMLRGAGAKQVFFMPAPLPLAEPSRGAFEHFHAAAFTTDTLAPLKPQVLKLGAVLHDQDAGAPTLTFLAMADPEDACANLEPLIRGFALAAQTPSAPPMRLILALAPSAQQRLDTQLNDWPETLNRRLFQNDADVSCENIWLFDDPMTPDALAALAQRADFTISAYGACAQNTSLQASIAQGCAPIATLEGEAAEYLSDESAFKIETSPTALTAPELNTLAPSFTPTAQMVRRAVIKAASQTPQSREACAQAAAKAVKAQFSLKACARRLAAALNEASALSPSAQIGDARPNDGGAA